MKTPKSGCVLDKNVPREQQLLILIGKSRFHTLDYWDTLLLVKRSTEKTKELLGERPDLLISVYTLLDRVQHFHWGESRIVEWYHKLDARLGELLLHAGFLADEGNKLIVISDHGFCSLGEAKVQTLPKRTARGKLKGDHHENALLITVNMDYEINRPQDIFMLFYRPPHNLLGLALFAPNHTSEV